MTLTQRITAVLLQREIVKRRRAQKQREGVVEQLDSYRDTEQRRHRQTTV